MTGPCFQLSHMLKFSRHEFGGDTLQPRTASPFPQISIQAHTLTHLWKDLQAPRLLTECFCW